MKLIALLFCPMLTILSGCQGSSEPDYWLAAAQGDVALIKQYIAEKNDLNAVHRKTGGSLLHQAAFDGHVEVVKLLLEAGADPDFVATSDGGTPLNWAASNTQLETARLLIEAGADVNVIDRTGSRPYDLARLATTTDTPRQTELIAFIAEHGGVSGLVPTVSIFEAVQNNNVELLKRHLLTGTNPDLPDPETGNTPLILASILGRFDIVFTLDDYLANLELKNKEGTTALYNAAYFCYPEIVKFILIEGADPQTTNAEGQTILEVMEAEWTPEMAEVYRQKLEENKIDRTLDDIRKTRPIIVDLLHRFENVKPPL